MAKTRQAADVLITLRLIDNNHMILLDKTTIVLVMGNNISPSNWLS